MPLNKYGLDEEELDAWVQAGEGFESHPGPQRSLPPLGAPPPPAPAAEPPPPPMPARAASWQAPGFGAGLDDTSLRIAQAQAGRDKASAAMGEAGSSFAQAMSRGAYKPDQSFWKGRAADADDGPKNFLARRQAEIQAQALKEKQELDDPTSPKSQRLRAFIEAQFPEFKQRMGPLWDSIAARDADFVTDYAKLNSAAAARKATLQAAQTKDAAALTEAKAKEERDRAQWHEGQGNEDRRAKDRNASYERGQAIVNGRDLARFEREQAARVEAEKRAEKARLEAEARAEERRIAAEGRSAQGDREKELRHAVVLGREFLPGASPTTEDGKQVKDADIAAANIDDGVAKLQAMMKQHGTIDRVTDLTVREAMQARLGFIQDQYRVIANLGVPSGKDSQLTERVSRDPTDLLNIILGRGSTSLQELQEAAWSVANRNAQIRGYAPRGAAKPGGGSGEEKVKVMSPDGKIGFIRKSRLDAALKAGGKLVP